MELQGTNQEEHHVRASITQSPYMLKTKLASHSAHAAATSPQDPGEEKRM